MCRSTVDLELYTYLVHVLVRVFSTVHVGQCALGAAAAAYVCETVVHVHYMYCTVLLATTVRSYVGTYRYERTTGTPAPSNIIQPTPFLALGPACTIQWHGCHWLKMVINTMISKF